jgi:hypothetical protein
MDCNMARRKANDSDEHIFDEYVGDTERELRELPELPGAESVVSPRMFCHRRLIDLEPACAAGIGLAISEAVSLCADWGVRPPDWLADAVAKLANERMSDGERRNRRDLALHKTRWNVIRDVMKLRAPTTVEACCAEVSEAFADHPIAGGEDAFKTSYYLIEQSGGERTTLERYQQILRRRQH